MNSDETDRRQVDHVARPGPMDERSRQADSVPHSETPPGATTVQRVYPPESAPARSQGEMAPGSNEQSQRQQRFRDTARSLFETCQVLTGATAGYVTRPTREGTQEILYFNAGQTGGPAWAPGAALLAMAGREPEAEVYRGGGAVYENDLGSGSRPEGYGGVDNVLFAPLLMGDEAVGVLGLANKPGGFGEQDARLALAFGELVAIALHNRRLTESLAASELHFRSVVETANIAIVTADGEGKITGWNNAAARIFSYTAAEITGAPLAQLIPERYRAAHEAAWQRVAATGRTRLAGETVETIGVRKGGEEFPVEMSLALWQTGEGGFATALMHDVTRRKQLEETMREARQFLETLVEASPLAITALDLDQNVRLWNPAAERIFGWSESEVLGRHCPLLANHEEFRALLAELETGQAVSGRETVQYRKDGSPIDASAWCAPLFDAQGIMHSIMVVLTDVTKRKRAEGALRRYAHEQNALYTVAAAMVSTLDQDRLVSVILDAVLPTLEADSGWILLPGPAEGEQTYLVVERGTSVHEQVADLTVPLEACPLHRCPGLDAGAEAEPAPVFNCSAPVSGKTGGGALGSSVCVPLSLGGQRLGILKLGYQQFEQVEQNQGLLLSIGHLVSIALHNARLYQAARQVNRLRALSDIDRALAATLEPRRLAEGLLQHVMANLDSPAASLLLLLPNYESLSNIQVLRPGRGWQDGTAGSEDGAGWAELVHRARAQRDAMPIAASELRLLRRGGDLTGDWDGGADGLLIPLWGEKALLGVLILGGRRAEHPFTDEDRALAQVAAGRAGQAMQNARLYDEIRQLLHQQEQTRAQLIQVEKLGALGRLAATIAHEISNPLQAVEVCLALFQEEMESRQRREKLDRYLQTLKDEVRRISAIVRRMRDYYRPADERFQPTDLPALLDSVLALSGKELQHRHIEVERAGTRDVPLIQANADHLRQVFMNLVLNAIDAMPGGGTLRISTGIDRVQPAGQCSRPAARVDVGDTGIGMSPETLAQLFEPLFTTKEQAAGLGLTISHSIVEAHNGQISVTSRVGSGSVFTVLLPITAP